jgi:hypothetical protein
MMNFSLLPHHFRGVLALLLLLTLTGCQSDSSEDDTETDAPGTPPQAVSPRPTTPAPDLDPRALASRYMRYAYQGALLRSDHPLNDSLAVLMSTPVGGQALTVIDTFEIASVEQVGDAEHTVQVQAPHAVRIKSVTWDTAPPVTNQSFTLRTSDGRLTDAPHVVGWPAFQRHIRSVAPDEAEAIIERMASELDASPSQSGA